MHTANPNEHYKPTGTARNTPLDANYAHTTPLVPPPVPIAATTTTTTTAVKQQPIVTAPTQHYASEPRANNVIQVLYPTAESRIDAQTMSTTRTNAAIAPAATVQRRGLDLDVTASHVDSYTAPTPIHLTIHPDPAESTAPETEAPNAIAYLHSVHPALPVGDAATSSSSSSLQQPQSTRGRRNSEGAATSLNGQWTPLEGSAAVAPQQHSASVERVQRSVEDVVAGVPAAAAMTTQQHQSSDIRHSSSVPPVAGSLAPTAATVDGTQANTHVPWGTTQGQAVYAPTTTSASTSTTSAVAAGTGAAYVTTLPTTQSERVLPMDASGAHASGRTVVPVAMGAAGPLIVGETRQVGGVENVSHVSQVSGMSGERVAVAHTHHAMPASHTFTSTTAPQVLFVPGHTTTTTTATTAHPPVQPSPSPRPVHGDQVYASEEPVIQSHPLVGSVVKTNPHDQQYYDNRPRVDRDAALAAGVAGVTIGAAVARQQMHSQPLSETSGPSIVQVSDATNLQGGSRTPLVVGALPTRPLVVGETRQVGDSESLREVDDLSMLSRGERVAVASVASSHQMPTAQTFTSTTGPQVIHTQQTYTSVAPHSTAMTTPMTHRLDTTTSTPSIVQVDNTSSLTGQRIDMPHHTSTGAMRTTALPSASMGESVMQVSDVSSMQGGMRTSVPVVGVVSGPMVVGETRQVGTTSNIMQVNEMRGERLPLANSTTQSTYTTMHTMPLTTESQPAIQYINQPTTTTHTAVQQPLQQQQQQQQQQQYAATTQHTTQQAAAITSAQRTTITHEPISASEAAAHTTTQPLTGTGSTGSGSGSVSSGIGYESRSEHIGAGPTQVLYVDKSRLDGKEMLGSEAFSTKKEYDSSSVEGVSGGLKGMQLGEKTSEPLDYAKEQRRYV